MHAPSALPAPRAVDRLLAHYAESHQLPFNEFIHLCAVPLIMLSLLGLIQGIHPWAAHVFVAASLVYYLRLSLVYFAVMAVVSASMLALLQAMGPMRTELCTGIFLVAWVFQFVGHAFEGKKPSFFEDLRYLWVGPLFVLDRLFGRFGLRG